MTRCRFDEKLILWSNFLSYIHCLILWVYVVFFLYPWVCSKEWLCIRYHIMPVAYNPPVSFNTLRPKQNGGHYTDDIFMCIFLKWNYCVSIKITPNNGPINYTSALVQAMAWRRTGDKPLHEPWWSNSLTPYGVTRPQCVKLWVILW